MAALAPESTQWGLSVRHLVYAVPVWVEDWKGSWAAEIGSRGIVTMKIEPLPG